MDWRYWAIIGIVIVSILATVVVYFSGYGLDPATHFGSVFAAWVGGLALFLLTGAAVAIVSLARPERESFDSRARILFRRQTGRHIDYIVSRIKEILEHYAEQTENKITILDFHGAEKKFRVSSSANTIVRSYLDDIESTYVSEISYESDTTPPDKGPLHRLVYARVGGAPVGASEDFTSEISRPLACRIDRDGTCTVSFLTEFWLRANDEDNTHTPKRYTQVMRWQFENLVSSN